jgi:transposase/Mor family transcriptional regulator
MPTIPESEYQAIADAYANGESQASIGKRYGVSHGWVGKILKKINHPTRVGCSRVYRSEMEENHEFIIESHSLGLSYEQIAEHLNISTGTIIYVLQQKGLWVPERNKLSFQKKIERAEKIVVAYKFGISIPLIKKKFSCSELSVYQALRQAGVEIRKKGYVAAVRGKANASQFNELYLAGFSCQEIAEELGFSKNHVWYLLDKYYPESLRNPAEAKKKRKLRETKMVNGILMEDDKYCALVSHAALRRSPTKPKSH